MSSEVRKFVSQDELDNLVRTAFPVAEEVAPETTPVVDSGWQLPAAAEAIGIHMKEESTTVVRLNRKSQIAEVTTLPHGYQNWDEWEEAMGKLFKHKQKRTAYLTLSGSGARFRLFNFPKMPKAVLQKAMRIQVKQAFGKDYDFQDVFLGENFKDKAQNTYLVGSVDKDKIDKTAAWLKKQKMKAVQWDLDVLAILKAGDFVWKKFGLAHSTRFIVQLYWDRSELLLCGEDRKLAFGSLNIGVGSFLENLLAKRKELIPQAPDGREWHVLPSESEEVRQRKVYAEQSLHDVYVPLAQQIRTQLYALCNDSGMELPTHFVLIAPKENLFGLQENLEKDIGLKAIVPDEFLDFESLGAVGALMAAQYDWKLNFLPRGMKEKFKAIRESLRGVSGKTGGWKAGLKLQGNLGTFSVIAGALFCIGLTYPTYQYFHSKNVLAKKKAESESLGDLREMIKRSKAKEESFDQKAQLATQIDLKRLKVSHALRELVSILPTELRFESLSFREGMFDLKGIGQSREMIERFLKLAASLESLTQPVPVGVTKDKDGLHFDIVLKFKG